MSQAYDWERGPAEPVHAWDDRGPESPRHSGFGIASFVLGLFLALLEFGLFAAAGVMEASTPGGMDENAPATIAIGLAMLAGIALCLLGLLLGVVSLFDGRRKAFGVLGICVNLAVPAAAGGLIAIGLAMGG